MTAASDPGDDLDPTLDPEPPPWDAFDGPERPPRTRRLLLLAAIPWMVVVILAVRTIGGPATTGTTGPEPSPTSSSVAPTVGAPATTPVGTPGPAPAGRTAVALRFGARVAPGAGDAAAVALVVARNWLGGIGPEPPVDVGAAEGPPVYVEHLAVESVDLPAPDAAVVTLVAIVMEADEGAYTSARVVRVAVPVSIGDGGARPAGDPWRLPPPDLSSHPPPWTPADDPDALADAGAALEAAGYAEVSVLELATSPTWPLRVTATAIAPGSDVAREHVVWLRDHLGRLVVAGALPPDQETGP